MSVCPPIRLKSIFWFTFALKFWNLHCNPAMLSSAVSYFRLFCNSCGMTKPDLSNSWHCNDWQSHANTSFCFLKAPVRHTLQPLCDLSATDNFHQSQRSQQGPRSVPARLQRSRRLIGDLVATKSVAARFLCLHKNLAATDLVADRSRQSRRSVPDLSPTSRRPIAD